tara:strand:+ start:310 stop:801 length:492 start_codon:yes stop_codon:yes gene_type:complete
MSSNIHMQKHEHILPSRAQIDALRRGDKFIFLGNDHGDDYQDTMVTVECNYENMVDFRFEDNAYWTAEYGEVGLPDTVRNLRAEVERLTVELAKPKWKQVLDGQVLVKGTKVRSTARIGDVLPGTKGKIVEDSSAYVSYPYTVIFKGHVNNRVAASGELEVKS